MTTPARDNLLRAMQDESIVGRKRQRITDAADGMAAEARAAALDEARAAVDSLRASNYGWASSLQNAALAAIDALRERSE